eukprot:TRINITY_DN8494_c0_g1_i1.p1 TRINITY_DN8494_c0_g1~~TRINITY_DN8494_c0_g1_i1.p1  ORF type:complete len:496 (+),score=125.85 TRINITY_DN8494_c0_g1_i1:119-1606(+)
MEYHEDISLEEFLPAFNKKHETSKEFNSELKSCLWKRLVRDLASEKAPSYELEALKSLKILSREKISLVDLANEDTAIALLKYCEGPACKASEAQALSCLNNLLLQVKSFASILSQPHFLKRLFRKESIQIKEGSSHQESLILRLRIGVIISVLEPASVQTLDSESVTSNLLLRLYEQAYESHHEDPSLLVEISKFLYNIWAIRRPAQEPSFERGAALIKRALVKSKEDRVQSHSINLLSALPASTYGILLSSKDEEGSVVFDGDSMTVARSCLEYLLRHLNDPEDQLEGSISPVLMFLCQFSREKRSVRRYLRSLILPPLKEVRSRPEVGDSPRNKLCKLLTSPCSSIETLSSEFLFILCKEQVERMVKYTGFGNAAGLLARKGLLGGVTSNKQGSYSDEDSDSETEEYASNSHKINPVVGCIEQPDKEGISPFEGMSEEQKEYEAMKLVGIIDRLNKEGLIRPAMPGPDGKVVPMEHILQMTEGIDIPKKTED